MMQIRDNCPKPEPSSTCQSQMQALMSAKRFCREELAEDFANAKATCSAE